MGCDIHVRTEVLFRDKWFDCDHYQRNRYYEEEYDDGEPEWEVLPIYDGRSYILFGILAGVRSNENEPIDEPRGLPADCNKHIREDSDNWGVDGHSHSYFTLRELLEYRVKHPKVKVSGMISAESAKKLDETGETPKEWCGWTNEADWVFREWKADSPLNDIINSLIKRECEEFWIFNKDRDKKILENADKIRIVFWFDN